MARRCAAGHLSSQAQASATGDSEVSPTRTRDVEALGEPGRSLSTHWWSSVALLQLGDGSRSKASLRRVSVLKTGHRGWTFIGDELIVRRKESSIQPTSDFGLSDEDFRLDSQKDKWVRFNP
jgi:hypothetical protein